MLRPFVLILAMLIVAPPAIAQSNEGEPRAATSTANADRPTDPPPKRTRWAVGASHGVGVEINSSKEVDITSLWLRVSHVLGGPATVAGTKTFLGGQPALAVELAPAHFRQSPEAWGIGTNVVYEHRLRPTQSVRPTIRVGAGTLYTTENVPPGETQYNFVLFVGAGIEVAAFGNKAIQIDYRLHHVSNADTGTANPGINAHTLVLGLAWGF